MPHLPGTAGTSPAQTAGTMCLGSVCVAVWRRATRRVPQLPGNSGSRPPQGAGACFRDPDVSAGRWMGIQDTLEGLSPVRPLLTSGSHQALPPLCAAVAAETPGRSLSGLGHAPEAPLVGPGRGGAEEALARP